MTYDSMLKIRDINLTTKFCLVKAMVFSVVMYGGESWTMKKAECRSIDAFELWCWRRCSLSIITSVIFLPKVHNPNPSSKNGQN